MSIREKFYSLLRLWPRSYVRTFFEKNRLLCDRCHYATPLKSSESFGYAPCSRCGEKLFLPLPIGDFLLFEPIGAGGISSVYKAYHRKTREKRVLAVKIIRQRKKNDQEIIDAFLAESDVHSRIPPHPNIVRYVDSGFADDEYFYAIEYVEGEKLARRLDEHGKIAEPETIAMIAQILAALKHIYNSGFLYRDLSAGNILIRPDGGVVLIDFGLTIPIEQARKGTREKSIWGTGFFISPERLSQSGEDACSVVYGLGMLMYYMLAGSPYMDAADLQRTALRHVSKMRLAVTSSTLRGVSDRTVEILNTMMRQDPSERYQSFDEAEDAVASL